MRIFITGTAGFIGYHLAARLLADGHAVAGYDGLTAYYDPALKAERHRRLRQFAGFTGVEAMLEDIAALDAAMRNSDPEIIIHLAAQPGVRYSLEAPDTYVSANVVGTLNVLEMARRYRPRHLLLASTSSIYGMSTDLPWQETTSADAPVSLYAATKKSMELLAHSYSHLFDIPTTAFRFFTVYGPWGRPDMALFRFFEAIAARQPIDVYGHGEMKRDFTYIDDLVEAVTRLLDIVPRRGEPAAPFDSLSAVAPFRIVNIGSGSPTGLTDFIDVIEAVSGRPVERRLLPMQPGDVPATFASSALLEHLTGYRLSTPLIEGVRHFAGWYEAYVAGNKSGDKRLL